MKRVDICMNVKNMYIKREWGMSKISFGRPKFEGNFRRFQEGVGKIDCTSTGSTIKNENGHHGGYNIFLENHNLHYL